MKGQCEKCGQEYGFQIENIKEYAITFRCSSCGQITKVEEAESDQPPMVLLESLEYEDKGGAPSSKSGEAPFVALETLEYKTDKDHVSVKGYLNKQSSAPWTMVAMIMLLAGMLGLFGVAKSVATENQNTLQFEMEKRLNAAIDEKIKKYNAFFVEIEEQVKQSADYLKKLYENPNPPADNGLPLLLPWDGKQYGNDEIRGKFRNEILIQKAFSAFLKEMVRNKPYVDLAYSGTQTNITAFSNDEVILFIEKHAPEFFPSKRPWYTKAETAGKLIWTEF